MSVTIEDLCQLMHDTYETAAVKHGWHTNERSRVSWAQVPVENKATMRDAVAVVVEAVRDDERAKYSPEAIQADIQTIMRALGMSTHAPNNSPHEVVHKEILPKINNIMENGSEATQSDIRLIVLALEMNTLALPSSSHEVVHKEILPKINRMKESLVASGDALERMKETRAAARKVIKNNYVEVRAILDGD